MMHFYPMECFLQRLSVRFSNENYSLHMIDKMKYQISIPKWFSCKKYDFRITFSTDEASRSILCLSKMSVKTMLQKLMNAQRFHFKRMKRCVLSKQKNSCSRPEVLDKIITHPQQKKCELFIDEAVLSHANFAFFYIFSDNNDSV